jgi:hypothetical protein
MQEDIFSLSQLKVRQSGVIVKMNVKVAGIAFPVKEGVMRWLDGEEKRAKRDKEQSR